MVRSVRPDPWLVAAALAAGAASQAPIERSDAFVALRFHPNAMAMERARSLADACWETALEVEAALKPLGFLPEVQLTLDVWVDAERFRAARREAGVTLDVDEVAMGPLAQAHVLLAPALPEQRLAFVGLPPDTRDAVVRQLAWLAATRTELGSQDPWLCQVLAAGVLDRLDNPRLQPGVDPRFDGRRLAYARRAAAGEQLRLAEWVDWNGVPEDRDTWRARWEVAGLCAQLLAERSASWPKKLFQRVKEAKEQKEVVVVRRAQVGALLGGKWDKIEARLQKLLADARGVWGVETPTGALRDGRVLLAGTAAAPARLVRLGGVPAGPFAVRGTVELAEVGAQQWRLGFVSGQRLLAVLFQADGCVIAEWTGADWRTIERHRDHEPRSGKVGFSVEATDVLRVVIDGEEVLRVEHGGFPLRDELAIACDDGVVWLADLRVEPLGAKRR